MTALRGILSNKQIDAKLEYDQTRGTEIHRTLLQRVVGTGDLHVRGSASNDAEVALHGIRDPYRYQAFVQEYHQQLLRTTDRPVDDQALDV